MRGGSILADGALSLLGAGRGWGAANIPKRKPHTTSTGSRGIWAVQGPWFLAKIRKTAPMPRRRRVGMTTSFSRVAIRDSTPQDHQRRKARCASNPPEALMVACGAAFRKPSATKDCTASVLGATVYQLMRFCSALTKFALFPRKTKRRLSVFRG